ncbi:MAG: serine hydrolase [Gammaproteobacteria bacterium]|nr:serine hydrolase [Gammaproteobacteria bacterium]
MIDEKYLASPEEVGIDVDKLAELRARVRQEVDQGFLPAAQFAVAKDGHVVAFESFGAASDDSLFCVFSATKAITSSAAWLLIQAGELDIQERVADIIEAFGTNGKEVVSVEQLFTHTAGFPSAPFRPLDWVDGARRLERFAQWRLNFEPGSMFTYHPTSGMWVIAEIIERRTGMTFQDFVRQRVAEPLGLTDMFVGLPRDQNNRCLDNVHVGERLTSADYAKLGLPEPPVTEVTEEAIERFNLPEIRAVGVPGGGGFMGAAELALFYQGLLHGGAVGGEEVWSHDTRMMGRKIRTEGLKDPLTGYSVSRGLGISIAGDELRNFRGFGHTNSEHSFGHNGAGGQLAWADPATGISFAYCTNGHDRNVLRQGRRGVSISNRAAVLSIAKPRAVLRG